MTEIEILEQEIAQKKEQLKQLKEAQKPHFDYECLCTYFNKYDPQYLIIESVKNNIRGLAKIMTTARLKQFARSEKENVCTDRLQPKMDEIGAEKIALCNEFIKEITPVVGKYMDKFIEMNKEKKLC